MIRHYMTVLLGILLLLISPIDSNSAEPKSSIDDLPIGTVLRCTLDHTGPGCLDCPPFCGLKKTKANFRYANETLIKRLKRSNVVVERSGKQVALISKSGGRATLQCDALPQRKHQSGKNQPQYIIACKGAAGAKKYNWKTTYPLDKQASRSGAIEFKHFLSEMRSTLQLDLKQLDPNVDATSPESVTCGAIGIILGGVNPVGGAAVYVLCEWFASNGLD